MCRLWSDKEVEEILKEIAEDEDNSEEDDDCPLVKVMAITLELHRFIEGLVVQIRSTAEPVSLWAVSEQMQLALEEGGLIQFDVWNFNIYQGPAILKELHRQPSADLLNERLADGLYDTIVVRLAHRILTNERERHL